MANNFPDKIANISNIPIVTFLKGGEYSFTYDNPIEGQYVLNYVGVSRYGQYSAPISILITYVFTFYNSTISNPTEESRRIVTEGEVQSVTNWTDNAGNYGAKIIYDSNRFNISLFSVSYSSSYKNYARRLLYKIE